MSKEDIEASPVCPSLNSFCSDPIGDLAAKVFQEFDNIELLVGSKSAEHKMKDVDASKLEKEGFVCPSFSSYCCSDKLADMAVKVFGELDNPTSSERKSEDHTEDNDDFTFVSVPKWGDKFFFDPLFPVFNRDLLSDQFSHRHLQSVEEKSKSTTGTDPSKRLRLRELFQEEDMSSVALPSSTSKAKRSCANDCKVRDSEGDCKSRSSKKKRQISSWLDWCLGNIRSCFP